MFREPDTQGLFDAAELTRIEKAYPEGMSAQQVIALFQARGVKLSEATFRKYVQLGLLPTSKRVGRKGKHRGSRGVYPTSVVRRINLIKRLMAEDKTLEEIRDGFVSPQNDVEQVAEAVDSMLGGLAERLERIELKGGDVKALKQEAARVRGAASKLVIRIERLSSRLTVADSNIEEQD